MEHFPEFENDVEFAERLISEQSVFCLPATVSLTLRAQGAVRPKHGQGSNEGLQPSSLGPGWELCVQCPWSATVCLCWL